MELRSVPEITVVLGNEDEIRRLYSYPNNFNEVGFMPETLAQTIEIYLRASLIRDGFADTTVVITLDGQVKATFAGSGASAYSDVLPRYLDAGRLGLEGGRQLVQDGKWRHNWRFFLPHGVALTNHPTVQLLHFPPDYVLSRDRDYLTANTTRRWAELLRRNGAEPERLDSYQNIIDIAPIAAPSDAGAKLEGVYHRFTAYIQALLALWLPKSGKSRPMVAFGSPVRAWLKDQFNVDLKVLSTSKINLGDGISAAVLAANHPSFIYNFVKTLRDKPETPYDDRVLMIMRVMQQDLIAAEWQVQMGNNPEADPQEILDQATVHWDSPLQRQEICELACRQALNQSQPEAQATCALIPIPPAPPGLFPSLGLNRFDEAIDGIRAELGAAESEDSGPDSTRL